MFFSCEDKAQINGVIIEPPQDEYISSDLNPGGDNFGHVGDLYLNLSGDADYHQEFWKFNYFHLTGGAHNGPDDSGTEDKLTLDTYNNSYYVSPEAFAGDNDGEIVYVYNIYDYNPDVIGSEEYVALPYTYVDTEIVSEDDCEANAIGDGLWNFNNNNCEITIGSGYDNISSLTTEIEDSSEVVEVNSSLILKTPALSINDPLEDMVWSIGENMYSFSTMNF